MVDIKFFFLGMVAAVFANMTGTGGGIVFFPAFVAMGIPPLQSAATSILIQSCGMTSGSISWIIYFRQFKPELKLMLGISGMSALFSVAGAYTYVVFLQKFAVDIHLVFRILSVIIAFLLLANYFWHKEVKYRQKPTRIDIILIILLTYMGGIVTGVTSIGVGELLAALLMFRHYRSDLAIATAVIVSAVTVVALAPYVTFWKSHANVVIALFAIPGAILGGYLARFIAKWISLKKLKLVFIGWVLICSIW